MSDRGPEEQPRKDAPPPRSVLEIVGPRAEGAPRVLLRDSDAEGPERLVVQGAPGASAPAGRGNYEIHGEIARGGMGRILKARDTDLGREVAIKVLDEKLAEEPFVLRRFVEEAQIGGQLQHPGVVPVYELGATGDELPYFTMKLVKGRTLAALLEQRRDPADDRRRFLAIFESVCQTIAYAHSKGVIHRDLKPANVMVGAFGEVLVVDWGLAKVLGQGGVADEERARDSQRTVVETVRSGPGSSGSDSVVGSVMGTPAYMPPEQARGEVERLDERADVFALGAILCEVLTGAPPYVEREGERVVVQAAQARLDPARERIAECGADAELRELCLECLSPAPPARPRDAQEVAQRVHRHLAGLEEKARAAELAAAEARVRAAGERRARRLTLGLAAAVVLALVTAGAAWRWTDAQEEERLAGARRGLDEAHAQVVALQQEGRWDDALEVARAAQASLVESGVAGAELRDRARNAVERAEERVAEARAEAEQRRKDAEFVARLEEIRLEQFGAFRSGRFVDLDRQFHEAFLAYGVDLSPDDFVAPYEALRDSEVAAEVVHALDDWSLARRQDKTRPAFDAEKLTMLALDLDPDELNTRVREAMLHGDRDELVALLSGDEADRLDPALLWSAGTNLWGLGGRDEAREFLDGACRRYRDDFLMNFAMGALYRDEGRPDRALVVQQAAATLRPQSAAAQRDLGLTLFDLGDLPAALPVLREALRLQPRSDPTREVLLGAVWSLGLLDEAIELLSVVPGAGEGLGVLALRCRKGEATVEELLERIEARPLAERNPGELVFAATALLERGSSQRALDQARRLGEAAAARQPTFAECWLAWADALVRTGEPGAVPALLDRAEPALVPGGRAAAELDYARAEAFQAMGETEAARAAFERAERAYRRALLLRSADWSRSNLVRRRERTARAMGE